MESVVNGAAEMHRFASDFVLQLEPAPACATVIALSGELGAGKTTFTQAAAKALGVADTVNSPTFVIEKIYSLEGQQWKRLVHIDAYRLKSADELRALGWDDICANPANLIIVEWPEHVDGAIPESARRIRIESGEGDARTLYVS